MAKEIFYYDKSGDENSTLPISIKLYQKHDNDENNVCFFHHTHPNLEILYVKQGCLNVTVENTEYCVKANEFVIVNTNKIHYGEWSEDTTVGNYCCISFVPSNWLSFTKSSVFEAKNLIEEGKRKFVEMHTANNPTDKRLMDLFDELIRLRDVHSYKSECLLISEFYEILSILFDCYLQKTVQASPSKNAIFMMQAYKYIAENFDKNISTSDAALAFYMNPSSFCRLFVKNFGTNFTDYLNRYRITYAKQNYQRSNMFVAEIATLVGFDDYSYFSRCFKKISGISPSKYFKKWKSEV